MFQRKLVSVSSVLKTNPVPGIPQEQIASRAASEQVPARASQDEVVARLTQEHIVPAFTDLQVICGSAKEPSVHIQPRRSENEVVARAAR